MKKLLEYDGGLYIGNNIILSSIDYEQDLKWDDAKKYCKSLNIDGFKDWRMPTRKEMKLIHEHLKDINYEKYKMYNNYYWTDSEESEWYAWVENMKYIAMSCFKEYIHSVRPIRVV
jgi:hypothetical protein